MMRYSLAALLLAVVAAALGCAALVHPTEGWASSIISLTLAGLALATLLALVRPRPARAFWVGVAVCGWGYVVLLFGPWFVELRPKLLTSRAVVWAHTTLKAESNPAPSPYAVDGLSGPSQFTTGYELLLNSGGGGRVITARLAASVSPPETFFLIGHCLWAWIAAAAGGITAALLAGPASRQSQGPS
jgi:hypothetical protein